MSVWGDTYHPTHEPTEPRDSGFATGVVYCRACGTLLRSDRGMATAQRVYRPCVPVPFESRARVVPPTKAPVTGFTPEPASGS